MLLYHNNCSNFSLSGKIAGSRDVCSLVYFFNSFSASHRIEFPRISCWFFCWGGNSEVPISASRWRTCCGDMNFPILTLWYHFNGVIFVVCNKIGWKRILKFSYLKCFGSGRRNFSNLVLLKRGRNTHAILAVTGITSSWFFLWCSEILNRMILW